MSRPKPDAASPDHGTRVTEPAVVPACRPASHFRAVALAALASAGITVTACGAFGPNAGPRYEPSPVDAGGHGEDAGTPAPPSANEPADRPGPEAIDYYGIP